MSSKITRISHKQTSEAARGKQVLRYLNVHAMDLNGGVRTILL